LVIPDESTPQRILDPGRRCLDEAAELGLDLLHFDLHFPGDRAVAEMAFYADG
jgi:hypothetical protein